jgi:hypothetical protein
MSLNMKIITEVMVRAAANGTKEFVWKDVTEDNTIVQLISPELHPQIRMNGFVALTLFGS